MGPAECNVKPYCLRPWNRTLKQRYFAHVAVGLLLLFTWHGTPVSSQNQTYQGTVSEGKHFNELVPVPPHNASKAIRITASSQNADTEYPVLFVVRQQRSVLSWAVPFIIQSMYVYDEVSHTLCPENGFSPTTAHNLSIDVTTASIRPVNFTLTVTMIDDFELRTHLPKTLVASPSNPKYYVYKFPDDADFMTVKVMSTSETCTIISVQPAQCPVYDQHRNIEFVGQFQTVTKQGAITVQKKNYPSGYFFVVTVVQPTDVDCLGQAVHYLPLLNMSSAYVLEVAPNRSKEMTILVDTILPLSEYWKPIVATVGVLLVFYVIAGGIMLVQWKRTVEQNSENLEEQVRILGEENSNSVPFAQNQPEATSSYGTTGKDSGGSAVRSRPLSNISTEEVASEEDDIDMLEDVNEEKQIYRTKMSVCVADLARKKPKTLDRKYKLYFWNILTIAVFYSLPAVQLVMTYQAVLNMSGNEDMCYYNFLCAMPCGLLSAFNNVFSNIGYVMLGFLYLLIVSKKHHAHKQAVASGCEKAKSCGIPKHFGMFYALGIALVMEGVLSGSYHVCPNYSNFQFDTAFMYIIAGLGMLVLYQQRHPDVNANAYAAFATFAAVIFIAFMGVVFVSVYFYAVFAVLHIITCLAVSAQMYYMGTWKVDLGMFKRAAILVRTELCKCAKPVYIDRMIVLIIGNAVNWSITIYGLVKMPKDFNSYLLAIFLVNLLLYVAFYIIMKVRNREKIIPAVVVITILALVIWGLALNFYFMGLTGWEKTAALSRESNAPCLLMGFYDGHDVWHILSAAALFLSFLLVLLMDEDLEGKDRMKIPVF